MYNINCNPTSIWNDQRRVYDFAFRKFKAPLINFVLPTWKVKNCKKIGWKWSKEKMTKRLEEGQKSKTVFKRREKERLRKMGTKPLFSDFRCQTECLVNHCAKTKQMVLIIFVIIENFVCLLFCFTLALFCYSTFSL